LIDSGNQSEITQIHAEQKTTTAQCV